jgi:short-subunit dehydrogenase
MNVLITGASAGIGRTAAEYLDSVGHRIVLVARNMDRLVNIADTLKNAPLCISYDLCDLDNIEEIFMKCKEADIKLDGLVHCAGINRDMPLKVNDVSVMMEVTKLNYMSFVELGKFFSMKKYSNDGASIVAMSSTAVYGCDKSMCTYAGSKAAIDTTVRVMSKEFAKRGIRVNSIQPNYVDTEMAHNTPDFESKIAAIPLGLIQPVYVAYLIEFLLSEKSKYISGSNIKMSSAAI